MTSKLSNNSVIWYMEGLTSRIVAESGIPSDRYHLGKMIMQGLKDYPDFILQIDGGTGNSDTNNAVLNRSIKCAICFQNFGLKVGDVIGIVAPNFLDVAIPLYASLYIGVIVATIDGTVPIGDLERSLKLTEPKIIFCDSKKATDIQLALNNLDLNTEIVTFDTGDYLCSFENFLRKYGDDTLIESFQATDFDAENTVALLMQTSGTTGDPKAIEATHKNYAVSLPYVWSRVTTFPGPTRMALVVSSLQWITAVIHYLMSAVMRYTRLQTSLPVTQEHAYYLINTYRPSYVLCSPTFMASLLKPGLRDQCDFRSFELMFLGGNVVPPEVIDAVKSVSPKTEVFSAYGMTELGGAAFHADCPPPGSRGRPMGCLQYRIVDMDTQEIIDEPNVPGELCVKGPGVFKGYYKNEAATAKAFAEDGWFKTGDIFYRDEHYYYYFSERVDSIMRYHAYKISPVEIENVIRRHPGVWDVAVTSDYTECSTDLPIACVVPRTGFNLTADEIKKIVEDSLPFWAHLRGGVVFFDELPLTATAKIHRKKLKEIVKTVQRY